MDNKWNYIQGTLCHTLAHKKGVEFDLAKKNFPPFDELVILALSTGDVVIGKIDLIRTINDEDFDRTLIDWSLDYRGSSQHYDYRQIKHNKEDRGIFGQGMIEDVVAWMPLIALPVNPILTEKLSKKMYN